MFKRYYYRAFYLCLIVVVIFVFLWVRFLVTPIVGANGLHFVLKPGTTAIRFAYELKDQGLLEHPHWFVLLMKYHGVQHQLKSGEYQFKPYSTPAMVIAQVKAGSDIYHAFTLINGWTIYQVMQALNSQQNIQHDLAGKSLAQIAKAIGIKESSPEGWLYPNTYFYRWGVSETTLLKRAYHAMQSYLKVQWPVRANNLPYRSPYQALIVASMIEKETAVTSEKPIIAAIILKRLKLWMHLQIDASVIYGMGPDFKGSLTRDDLRRKTPYNLYQKYGLPPTPIAMPSPSSIYAALHPAATEALYYVAKGDGTHIFSQTLAQQRKAIQRYLLDAQNKNTVAGGG